MSKIKRYYTEKLGEDGFEAVLDQLNGEGEGDE